MILDTLVKQVAVLEKMINDLRVSMRHASPFSVNALRSQKEELEAVYEELMESCVLSNFDLEYLLGEHDQCIKDCFQPVYTKRPVVLPKPIWDVPPPPPPAPPMPTVSGVNLILYIDTTGSMRGQLSGSLRNELTAFANYLASESTRASIPCNVSLVWFGDRSDGDGEGYKTISMNKESVADFHAKVASPKWYNGGSTVAESGLLAIQETLQQLVEPGVANTLIYITDAPAKSGEYGATPDSVRQLIQDNGVKAYGIYPLDKEPDLSSLFSDKREYTTRPYNITPWADATLIP